MSTRNPFPGLRPFTPAEEYLFFGREKQVDGMVDKLASHRFLAVLGSSGSGKSSLVNCGLQPALHRGLMAATEKWKMMQLRPGPSPLKALARALGRDRALFPQSEIEGLTLEDLIESTLRLSKLGLIDVCTQARLDPGLHLLVVVDQFEELFRYRSLAASQKAGEYGPEQEATAFVNLLIEAAKQRALPIFVVLTMRADFLGDCAQFQGLPEAINQGQFLVPRMTREERRAAISGPIKVAQAELSPILLTRLVNDTGDDPDQLSILQHALQRTWVKWEEQGASGAIDLEHYEATGGMALALDQHAEEAFAELATERQRKICEKLFKALTDKGTDPRGVRRPARLSELCALCATEEAELTAIINVFRDPRRSFLMPPAPDGLTSGTAIDVSHESLMRIWKRLRRWTDEEAAAADAYRKLRSDAELHARGERSLWRDPELRLGLDWRAAHQPTEAWASRYAPGFAIAMAFLNQSAEAQRRSRIWRRVKIWGAVAVAFLAIGMIAGWSWYQKDEAQRKLTEFLEDNPELREDVRRLREQNRGLRLEILELAQTGNWLETTISQTRASNGHLRQTVAQLRDSQGQLAEEKDGLLAEGVTRSSKRDELKKEEAEARRIAEALLVTNGEWREKLLTAKFRPTELPLLRMKAAPEMESDFPAEMPFAEDEPVGSAGPPDFDQPGMLLQDLEDENRRLKMLGDELRAENKKLVAEKAERESKVATARAELDKLESEREALTKEKFALRREIEALQKEVATLSRANNVLEREIAALNASKQRYEQWSRALQEDNKRMQAALEIPKRVAPRR